MKLRGKLFFISLLTFVVLVILGLIFQIPVNKQQEKLALDGIIRLLEVLIESENEKLADAVFENQQKKISSILVKMLDIQGVENVILYNADRYMIDFALGSDPDGSGLKYSGHYDLSKSFSEEMLYENKDSMQYEHTLGKDGKIAGIIEIFYSLQEIKDQSRKSYIIFLGSISLSLVLTFLFMFLMLSRAVVSPLTRLISRVENMNLEDSEINIDSIEIESDDELGKLTSSINQLARKINNYSYTLQKQNKQLVKSQKMETLGTLTGGLAHDFNNILGGIIGSVSLLKLYLSDGDLTDQKLEDNLDIIEKSAKRATSVVRKLMDFSRKGVDSEVVASLNSIVSDVMDLFRTTVDKSLFLDIDLSEENLSVSVDPGQISQVVLNLCINAAHAMTTMQTPGEKTGGTLKVESGRTLKNKIDYCYISVSDSGIGIDESDLPRIFDPFYTTKIETGGTGLGLSMVSSIVARHKGLVEVESVKGTGTTFFIYLPFFDGDISVYHKEKREKIGQSGINTILLVDDEELIREVSMELLVECGYKVLIASGGQEALEIYRGNYDHIDLVMLDMAMPGMSGDEVYRKLKLEFPDIRILISSGSGITEKISELLKDKNVGYVNKPYTLEELSVSILKVLNRG
ncbi:MAG: ATP-binding protein [Spirochaetales bacterium]|nr:ATP-binding protein [Spirochaetales bacterium]